MQKFINATLARVLSLIAIIKDTTPPHILANMVLRQDLGQAEYNRMAVLLFT